MSLSTDAAADERLLIAEAFSREGLARGVAAVAEIIRGQLDWELVERPEGVGFSIHSDPAAERHVLTWPVGLSGNEAEGPPLHLGYVEALLRALFAERAHPLFAGPCFCKNVMPGVVEHVVPALTAATDWFVRFELFRLFTPFVAPDVHQLGMQAASFLQTRESLAPGELVEIGHLLAAARSYLRENVQAEGDLGAVMEAFQRTPPDRPSIFALRALADKLLRIAYGACLGLGHDTAGRPCWLVRAA